jgi:hypothetical protein
MEILNLKLQPNNKIWSIQVWYILFIDLETDLNLIILIKSHLFFKNVVGIIDFDKLFNYKQIIGQP